MAKTATQLEQELAEVVRKSPVRVACRTLLFNIKACHWEPSERFRGARFTSRRRHGVFAVVHPSTKSPGMWQVSMFDADGASGDSQHRSAKEALAQVPPKLWKLAEF